LTTHNTVYIYLFIPDISIAPLQSTTRGAPDYSIAEVLQATVSVGLAQGPYS